MSTIQTKEFVTTGNVKVVMKTAITYGESQEITDVYRDDKTSQKEQVHQADKLGVEKIVVSIDGVSENIYKVFSDLPLIEARQIGEQIKAILDPKVEPKP